MTAQGMPTVPWNERRDSEQRLLKAQLRRAERWRQIKAALLVAPLLLFLLVFFLLPILGMLVRSVENSELREVMPETAALVRDWDGTDLPGEPVFASAAR
jgi:putative spermidine/putrescine transport system permease protein